MHARSLPPQHGLQLHLHEPAAGRRRGGGAAEAGAWLHMGTYMPRVTLICVTRSPQSEAGHRSFASAVHVLSCVQHRRVNCAAIAAAAAAHHELINSSGSGILRTCARAPTSQQGGHLRAVCLAIYALPMPSLAHGGTHAQHPHAPFTLTQQHGSPYPPPPQSPNSAPPPAHAGLQGRLGGPYERH